MTAIPADLRFTKDHEWARKVGDLIEVGITAFAVEQLGDVTLVDLSEVGSSVTTHGRFGDIESVKTVSELFAPVAGEIVETNDALRDKPELVNEDTYSAGWMIRIRPASPGAYESLMSAAEYEIFLGTLDH
jgi:glycine cleavage system H protein